MVWWLCSLLQTVLVISVICLHLFIYPALHYWAVDLSSQGNMLSMKTHGTLLPLLFLWYWPSFSIRKLQQCSPVPTMLYGCNEKSVSDPSGYWLVQWLKEENIIIIYIHFVSLAGKYLVVPLDGAIVFRKYCHFTDNLLGWSLNLKVFSREYYDHFVNGYRFRLYLCLLNIKYYWANGPNTPFG